MREKYCLDTVPSSSYLNIVIGLPEVTELTRNEPHGPPHQDIPPLSCNQRSSTNKKLLSLFLALVPQLPGGVENIKVYLDHFKCNYYNYMNC